VICTVPRFRRHVIRRLIAKFTHHRVKVYHLHIFFCLANVHIQAILNHSNAKCNTINLVMPNVFNMKQKSLLNCTTWRNMHCINRACILMHWLFYGLKFNMVVYLSCEYFNSKHFIHFKNAIIHIHLSDFASKIFFLFQNYNL